MKPSGTSASGFERHRYAWGHVTAAMALFGDTVVALRIVALVCATASLPVLV